jgi:hypothetical protein
VIKLEAQTLINEYLVDDGLNYWNCWDVWDDYMIACGEDPGGIKRFEIWNTTEVRLIRTFPRPTPDMFVKGYKDYYIYNWKVFFSGIG